MAIVVAVVAAVVALVPGAGFSPSVKVGAAAVVAGAVMTAGAEEGAEMEVVVARGLSIKATFPPAAGAVAAALAADVAAAAKVKPEPAAGAGAAAAAAAATDVMIGEAKRVGPKAGVGWVDAGGAGVEDGLIPKANPPLWAAVPVVVETD